VALPNRFLAKPRTIAPAASAQLAAEQMDNAHVGSLVVIDERDNPVGILTDRDIALGVLCCDLAAEAVTVAELMSTPLHTIQRDQSLAEAAHLMRVHGIRRLPIVDAGGALLGLIAADDLIQILSADICHLSGAVQKSFVLESLPLPNHGSIFGPE
jgi:CBS domain-containing protein